MIECVHAWVSARVGAWVRERRTSVNDWSPCECQILWLPTHLSFVPHHPLCILSIGWNLSCCHVARKALVSTVDKCWNATKMHSNFDTSFNYGMYTHTQTHTHPLLLFCSLSLSFHAYYPGGSSPCFACLVYCPCLRILLTRAYLPRLLHFKYIP